MEFPFQYHRFFPLEPLKLTLFFWLLHSTHLSWELHILSSFLLRNSSIYFFFQLHLEYFICCSFSTARVIFHIYLPSATTCNQISLCVDQNENIRPIYLSSLITPRFQPTTFFASAILPALLLGWNFFNMLQIISLYYIYLSLFSSLTFVFFLCLEFLLQSSLTLIFVVSLIFLGSLILSLSSRSTLLNFLSWMQFFHNANNFFTLISIIIVALWYHLTQWRWGPFKIPPENFSVFRWINQWQAPVYFYLMHYG